MTFAPSPLLSQMIHAAAEGCNVIKKIYDQNICHTGTDTIIEKNGQRRLKDFQTLADTQAETLIQSILADAFPHIGFYGEETSSGSVTDFAEQPYFILDPLDGTSNFVAARDYFAVSLGYAENQSPRIGVIADPVTGRIVAAETGHGAYHLYIGQNAKKLPMAQVIDLQYTQLDCEFSFTDARDIEIMSRLTPHSMGMRKHGSTAVDIMQMACGRRSALIADNQKPYDIAAGLVIAAEIGMHATNWAGAPVTLTTPDIIIANPQAHQQILALL